MRNKNLVLIVCGLLSIGNPVLAMLGDKEGEFGEERAKSPPIPIVKKIDQELPKLPIPSIEMTEFPVVKRRVSITAPVERRRKSSGTVGEKISPRISPRQSSGFSPPDGKKESPRISVSPCQIAPSSLQDKQSRSPGRDESPMRLRSPERSSSSHEEQSRSPVSPRADLLGSPGRMLISSSKDRELTPIREGNDILTPPKQTESNLWNAIIARERKRIGPKEGMKRYILDKEGNLHNRDKDGNFQVVLPKSLPVSSQEQKIDVPEHQSISSQEKKLDLLENQVAHAQEEKLDSPNSQSTSPQG